VLRVTHTERDARRGKRLIAAALGGLGVFAATLAPAPVRAQPSGGPQVCGGAAIALLPAGQGKVVEGAIDVSPSDSAARLRRQYLVAAEALVDEAASAKAALRIVTFGASGVGARVVVQVSFADVSQDELFNLAATNRARCAARLAVRSAVMAERRWDGGGTDVSGTLAALLADAKARVGDGGSVLVTTLTDGCQAPALSGPNRRLTDLCGAIGRGASGKAIVQRHPKEFAVGSAAGATIVMRGVGLGGNPRSSNSVQAQKLLGFWRLVCHRARPARCAIGSSVL
jgi:hypothetical protein